MDKQTVWRRSQIGMVVLILMVLVGGRLAAQSVGSGRIHPFVTSIIPVVGLNGAVGGVSIDAEGVVRRLDPDAGQDLAALWREAQQTLPDDMERLSDRRLVSLRGLDDRLEACLQAGTPVPDAVFFLAGLQRVEYVFVVPSRNDIVLAGPAEGWRMTPAGDVVGATTGRPVLRLDDLMVALRTSRIAASGHGISCSMDPTPEGLVRLQRVLKSGRIAPDAASARRLAEALGPQVIRLTGVRPDSHFAAVLVGADFMMKRLAMGEEPSGMDGLPSYLDMLSGKAANRLATPRWWLAVDYDPIACSPDGLAWQIRGQGVQTLTQDGYLGQGGQIVETRTRNRLAERWAEAMTERYDALSMRFPVFGKLRNCMDLSVVAALIDKYQLLSRAELQLAALTNEDQTRVPEFHVPRTCSSQARFVRARAGWVVSVSGGIDVDSWAPLDHLEEDAELLPGRADTEAGSWWWD